MAETGVRTALVTGASSGIGLATARAFRREGWRVIGVGHRAERCVAARAELLRLPSVPAGRDPGVDFLVADLASLSQVRGLAASAEALLAPSGGALEALVHVAGTVRGWYSMTEDGFETQFAVNHLAAFHLSSLLLPALRRAGRATLLVVSSGSHRGGRIDWEDPMLRRRYGPLRAYAASKLANLLFAAEFNRRYASPSLRAYALDPGLVDTGIGQKESGPLVSLVWRLRRRGGHRPEVPAECLLGLAAAGGPDLPEALYWKDSRPLRPSRRALDPEEGRRLWELSERLCGPFEGAAGKEHHHA